MIAVMREEGQSSTLTRVQDEVKRVLAGRVEVEAVEMPPQDGMTFVTIRLPDDLTEQERLGVEEWVQVQLSTLQEGPDSAGVVYVARYV